MPLSAGKRIDPNSLNLKEQVVAINRVTKVVKGGKNMSFSALVVVGDPAAKWSGMESARPRKSRRPSARGSKPRRRICGASTRWEPPFRTSAGRFGSGLVLLKPAKEGRE
jgi:small subunit ribosomal protein S5